jgi:hypothetical protein
MNAALSEKVISELLNQIDSLTHLALRSLCPGVMFGFKIGDSFGVLGVW